MGRHILYYVVGPVHPRNMQLIADSLPDWSFSMVYEPGTRWMTRERLDGIPFERIALAADMVPETLSPDGIAAVIFSTVQPRRAPMNLLHWALTHRIPTLAVQESNQFALNNGTINNYLLPVDHVLVASPFERRVLIGAGVPEHRIDVTGWPFYTGVEKVTGERRRSMKSQLGLEPDQPVAALTLTAFGDAGETALVRRRQLELAAKGLPQIYQLVVKPHPIEKMEVLTGFVRECAPRAEVVEGRVPISGLLAVTDVLLNRGVSQVAIEALISEIPVVVLEMGDKTPFHGLAPEVIAREAADLPAILARLDSVSEPLLLYQKFCEEHIPYSPLQARQLVCQRIAEIASGGSTDPDPGSQWLDLALFCAWKILRTRAREMLTPERVGQWDLQADALRRLIEFRAEFADLEILRQWLGDAYRSHVLRCLWIDQLNRHRAPVSADDLAWMRDFPSATNIHLFYEHCADWAEVLLRSGYRQEAEEFVGKLSAIYVGDPNIGTIAREIGYAGQGFWGMRRYKGYRLLRKTRGFLKEAKNRWFS